MRFHSHILKASLFSAILVMVLGLYYPAAAHPGSLVIPRDNCAGFPDPNIPALTSEPFRVHIVPGSSSFIPPAIADYDNDGKPDLPWARNLGNWNFQYISAIDDMITSAGYSAIISRNLQSSRSSSSPDQARTYLIFHGGTALDYDHDGKEDFIVAPYEQPGLPIMLFHNLGNWQFEFAFEDYFRNLLGWTPTATWQSETFLWGDLTGDGNNDLYLTYNTYKEPLQSIFLQYDGSTFTEDAMARGIGLPGLSISLRPEGATMADLNGDGNLDLYVAHHLFINDGAGYFTDQAAAYGLPVMFDEGASFVDYNNDGLLDLYVRNPDATAVLFRNTGSGFVNASVDSGLTCLMQNLAFFEGDTWADFDRDGDIDLLITYDWRNAWYALFLNQGDGTFRLGYARNRLLDLPATADFDGDGDLDVWTVYNEVDENLIGDETSSYDLMVDVVDSSGYESETGTLIRLSDYCTGQIQTRVVGGESVYLTHGEYPVHFALPYHCAYQVQVMFPKKGSQPKQVLVIPYNPVQEDSLKITVSRSGYTKQAYPYRPRYQYYFPDIERQP